MWQAQPSSEICTCISEPLHQLCNSRSLLANSNIDTVQLLFLICSIIKSFLVDYCVNCNWCFPVQHSLVKLSDSFLSQPPPSCVQVCTVEHTAFKSLLRETFFIWAFNLPSLPVTNDQLTLSPANWHQAVHGLNTSLHGFPHRDSGNDARGLQANSPTCLRCNRTLKREKKPRCSLHHTGESLTLSMTLTFPSMGLPRASTTRPSSSSPTGTSTMAPVLFTTSPSLISLSLPNTTTPTLSGSKFKDIP